MADEMKVESTPRKGIPVNLVGVDYTVRKPKAALGLRLAVAGKKADEDPENMMKAMDTLVLMVFGKKDAKAVDARLSDPEDDLDFEHLVELVQALGATGENPTT